MADGRLASMCPSGVSLVFALATAVCAIRLDSPDHYLDGKHYPHVHRLASAQPGTSVCASGLGDAVGVRSCGDCRWSRADTPNHSAGRADVLSRLAALARVAQPKSC